MGALTIAFDTTIVGALALPWLVLVVHLFFLGGEGSIKVLLRWVRRLNQPAVVSVVLFAMTYSLGSAVSRIAQDFFNDDDLNLQFPSHPPLLIRVGVTEYRILASVYCQNAAPVRPQPVPPWRILGTGPTFSLRKLFLSGRTRCLRTSSASTS
jgi:hypothetical protein